MAGLTLETLNLNSQYWFLCLPHNPKYHSVQVCVKLFDFSELKPSKQPTNNLTERFFCRIVIPKEFKQPQSLPTFTVCLHICDCAVTVP